MYKARVDALKRGGSRVMCNMDQVVLVAMCNVQCAMCNVQGARRKSAMCKVQGAMCNVHCAMCNVQTFACDCAYVISERPTV